MVSNKAVGFHRAGKWPALWYWLDAVLMVFLAVTPVYASNHYTDHQLDALATRVGKIYWIVPVKNQTPAFLSNPTANATSFHPQANESFEITELVGRKDKTLITKSGLILEKKVSSIRNLSRRIKLENHVRRSAGDR